MKKFSITTIKGRKKSRSIPRWAIQNPRKYRKEKQAEIDLKKRNEKKNRELQSRKTKILSLREELYGSLSIDQVKPHAILEFMEVYDRLIDEQNPKFLAYEQVSRKYSIGERTIQR